jgi:hypothetical protein
MRSILLGVACLMLTLSGCKSLTAPMAVADTAEQKAFALYGTFVAFEEVGASLAVDQTTPAAVRAAIKQADATAKPAADALLGAARQVLKVKAEIGAGTSSEDRLAIVNANLLQWVTESQPKILALQCAVNPKQEVCQKE